MSARWSPAGTLPYGASSGLWGLWVLAESSEKTSSPKVDVAWRYLLLSETDIREARGSWAALRRAGGY